MELRGRKILITGASSGIGAALAVACARRGASLALLARGHEGLAQTQAAVEAAGGTAVVCPVDLADPAALETAVTTLLRDWGVPDVLVNNAGAGRWLFAEETPGPEAEMQLAVPLHAALHMVRLCLPGMLARDSGYIVTVNSPAALVAWPGATGYTTARWGLRGLHEALTADLYPTRIRTLHCIFGKVNSNYFAANGDADKRLPRIARMIPEMSPEDAARHLVHALESNRSRLIQPLMLRLFHLTLRISPGLVSYLVRRSGVRRGFTPPA